MILRGAARQASFHPEKMGKSDLGAGEQLFVGLNAFEPGQTHEPHTHCDRDKLYVVLEGQGDLTIGEERSEVHAGDVGIARAGVVHSLHNPGPDRLVVLVGMAPPPPAKS